MTCINETGIKTKAGQYDLDIIVFATGFDGVTGAYNKVNITGEDGTNLSDEWKEGPETFLACKHLDFLIYLLCVVLTTEAHFVIFQDV